MHIIRFKAVSIVWLCGVLAGCGGTSAPLDAGTRQRIDSTVAAQTRLARLELDSLCVILRATELPRMVDSIKQKRLEEIERQLRTVPK